MAELLERRFFELLQVALGKRAEMSENPSDSDWEVLYDEAWKQSVAGICFAGIQKLPEAQRPPEDLYYQWLGDMLQIQQQNELLDQRTATVWRQLKEAGLDAVVLKGQGVAVMYDIKEKKENVNLGTLRQSGDIDIWVKGGYQTVCDYVQRTAPTDDVAYHRFHYDVFEDTEVELHHRPTLMRNLLDDRKLARWYESFGAGSFVYLEDKGFAVPPLEFNRIFILTHIYRHFLFEGIGLRQVMDLYFVLKGRIEITETKENLLNTDRTDGTDEERVLMELRLTRFAEAMMWLLHTRFGLEEKYLMCGMHEKEGRFLQNEIMQTGNFGQGDERYQFKRFYKLRHHIAHGSHLLMHYPSEVLWTPIWLMYHKVWKWRKKREIRRMVRIKDVNS